MDGNQHHIQVYSDITAGTLNYSALVYFTYYFMLQNGSLVTMD